MDSLDALYAAQIAATSQTTQSTAASSQTAASESDVAFADLLASLTNTSSSTNQLQQYLISGLQDGSISAQNSDQLVSALVGTLGTGSGTGLESLTSFDSLSGTGGEGFSQDTLQSLLALNQDLEGNWMEQIMKTLTQTDDSTGSDSEDSSLQAYYQAMSAMSQAQMNLFGGNED